jgi:Ca2+/Na+ antiporter
MNNKLRSCLTLLIGLIIFGAGGCLVITLKNPQGVMQTLPYVCIGVGSGVSGSGIGRIVSLKRQKKNPDFERQMEIEKKDERSIAISNRAKAKAYNTMIYVFAALLLTFALMRVNKAAVLLLVAAYIIVIASNVYWHFKYSKDM